MKKPAPLTQAPPSFSSVKFMTIGQQPELLKRLSDKAPVSASGDGDMSPPQSPRSQAFNDDQAEGAAYTTSGRLPLLQTLGGDQDSRHQSASAIGTISTHDSDEARFSLPLTPAQAQVPSTRTQYSSAGDRSARSLSQSRKASSGSSNTAPSPNPNTPATSSNFGPPPVSETSIFSNLPAIPNVFHNASSGSQTETNAPPQNQPQQPQLSPTPDLVYPYPSSPIPNAVLGPNIEHNHRTHSSSPLANHDEGFGTNPNAPRPQTDVNHRLNPDSLSHYDAFKALIAEHQRKLQANLAQSGHSEDGGAGQNAGQDIHMQNLAESSLNPNPQPTLRPSSTPADAGPSSNSQLLPEDIGNRDHTRHNAQASTASASSSSASHFIDSIPNAISQKSSNALAVPVDFDSMISSAQKGVDDLVSARASAQRLSSSLKSSESRCTYLQAEVNHLQADNGRLREQYDRNEERLDHSRDEITSLNKQIQFLRERLRASELRELEAQKKKEKTEAEAAEVIRVAEHAMDFVEEAKQRAIADEQGTRTRHGTDLKEKLHHERAEALKHQKDGESSSMKVEMTDSQHLPQTLSSMSNTINQTTQPSTPPTVFRNLEQHHNERSASGGSAPVQISPATQTTNLRHLRESALSRRSSDNDTKTTEKQSPARTKRGEQVSSIVKTEEELPDTIPPAVSAPAIIQAQIPERPGSANQNDSPSSNAPLVIASHPGTSNRNALTDNGQHRPPHSIDRPLLQSQATGSNPRVVSNDALPRRPSGPLPPFVSTGGHQANSVCIASPTTIQASKPGSRQNNGTSRVPEQGVERSRESTTSNSVPRSPAAPIGSDGGWPVRDDASAPNPPSMSLEHNPRRRPSPSARPVAALPRRSDRYSPPLPPPSIVHRRVSDHYSPPPSAAPPIPDRHRSPPYSPEQQESTRTRNRKRPREDLMDSYIPEYHSPPPRRARREDSDRRVVYERPISPRNDGTSINSQWNGPRTPPIPEPRTPPLPPHSPSPEWPQHEARPTSQWTQSYEDGTYEPNFDSSRRAPSPQRWMGTGEEPTTTTGSGSLSSRLDNNYHSQNSENHPSQPSYGLLGRMSDSQGGNTPSRLYKQDRADSQSFSIAAKRGQHQSRGGGQGRGQGPMRGHGKQPRGRGGKSSNTGHGPLADRLSSSKPSNNPPLHDRIS